MPTASQKRRLVKRQQARVLETAYGHGEGRAAAALAARPRSLAAASGKSGLLIAEGDSWFDYPGGDVLSILEERFGYRVESVAHHGDTVESMAYDDTQLKKLLRVFEHVRQDGRTPRAVLLSGGGNDIAGDEFAVLLNHQASGLPPLNTRIVEGMIEERLRFALGSLIGTVTKLSERFFGRKLPVLLHGYAYPVPDGRGFLGGFWFLPGPWLRPGFEAKAYKNDKFCADVLVDLIDRFNSLQRSIAGTPGFEHVTYVNLRTLLSNQLPSGYKRDWANELHPTQPAFAVVANAFDGAIRRVAPMPKTPASALGGSRAPRSKSNAKRPASRRPRKATKAPGRRGGTR
jgi:lysophospholipase L1-like esterase